MSGLVDIENLKQTTLLEVGTPFFLTKPLGVGIISTAVKRGKAKASDVELASQSMRSLNRIGPTLARINGVNALTDVTGFGLLGHLTEIMTASALNAEISLVSDTKTAESRALRGRGMCSRRDGPQLRVDCKAFTNTHDTQCAVLSDPQTSGGLLVTVEPEAINEVTAILEGAGLPFNPIGRPSQQLSEKQH